jgi:hypothetical protein
MKQELKKSITRKNLVVKLFGIELSKKIEKFAKEQEESVGDCILDTALVFADEFEWKIGVYVGLKNKAQLDTLRPRGRKGNSLRKSEKREVEKIMKEVEISLKICKCEDAERFVSSAIRRFIDTVDKWNEFIEYGEGEIRSLPDYYTVEPESILEKDSCRVAKEKFNKIVHKEFKLYLEKCTEKA